MAFSLAQFQLILAICEHGSLGKASQVMGVTQPALSRNLRELERQLGIKMFERHPSGLRPTKYCLKALPYAANAIEEAARALEEVRILAGESQEVVRIGAIVSACVNMIPALIERLLAASPDICIRVSESVEEVLVQALFDHEIDLLICGTALDIEGISRAIDLGTGDICTLLVSTGHPLAGRDDIAAEEIIRQPWAALPRDAMLRKILDRLVAGQGLPELKVLVETRSVNVIRGLVEKQGFITWGPAPPYGAGMPGSGIVALQVPHFELQRQFFVYRLTNTTVSGSTRRAMAMLQRMSAQRPHKCAPPD